jgi:hypothetical protein
MEYVSCSACQEDVAPRAPSRSFWGLIVSFWVFSLLFGIGAALTGWSFILLLAWVLMASTVGVLAQRATCWTCSECGSSVLPPASAVAHGHAMQAA